MRFGKQALCVLAATSTLSCGGGSSDGSPTGNPTPVAATVDLTLSSSTPMTALGETRSLSVTVRDASHAVIPGASVSFSTNNAAVATVSGSGGSATITAVGNGDATITATSGSASANVSISVAQSLSNVSLVTTPVVMGSTLQLSPVARDSRNAVITGASGYTYTSSNPAVAVVNANGLLSAIAPGTTTIGIALTRNGVSATGNATVTVLSPVESAAPVTIAATINTTFEPPAATVNRGGTVTFAFSTLAHTVTFETAGAPANIGLSFSTSVGRVFPSVGVFPYHCDVHAGMTGTVTVVQNDFLARLDGQQQRPVASSSAATGGASFVLNGSTVNYVITYQGLSGAPTSAHLHGPAGPNGVADILVNFSTTAQTGSTGVITGSFNASAIQSTTGQPISLDALVTLLRNSNAYVDIHTAQFPNGEVRGQVNAGT